MSPYPHLEHHPLPQGHVDRIVTGVAELLAQAGLTAVPAARVAVFVGNTEARREPLLTLGSAPLEVPAFRSVVLGQLGESRLAAAIDTDIAGTHSRARALDADTRGALRHIHCRVGTVILFESPGGQVDKVAHLPELRFALGELAS